MPKIVDHEQRRGEIALALWQVIHEHGIDGVSFRAVAEAAGVSIGRVQHYFSSKDELVVFGCRAMVSAAEQDHGPDPSLREPARARDALADFLCAPLPLTEGLRVGSSVWATYLAKSVSHPGIAAVVAEAMHGRAEATATLLAAARGTQEAREAQSTALALVSLSEGLNTRVLAGALVADEAGALIRDAVDRAVHTD
ncbi:TetR/AcrR family transcriptional regulator [Citricoccus muralis]|uniref:TetR family transcriptional regulator n=1 Tax=Citricoccus muralis TaxID=169134 RepID=A0A3D9LF81_9MICC|nr:TetR/AcrR family transcriptional regulator [Citricoccus muralis]REE04500.1 TetR family transcriptional regulator [Citricoccus muralis]